MIPDTDIKIVDVAKERERISREMLMEYVVALSLAAIQGNDLQPVYDEALDHEALLIEDRALLTKAFKRLTSHAG